MQKIRSFTSIPPPTAQNKRLSSFQAGYQRLPANPPGKQTYIVSACVKRLATRHCNQQNQRATDCNFSDVNSVLLLQLDAF
ncbi:hypothetical protein DMB90_26450 [Raoultella planticola]|uniref:Uncharacterized protein n=1 Tax=Raoultella planticola TaxID=575 RepID=A0A5P6AAW5_RAOPL|nr:hypothetical protein DMB90_26450 [Raoultella planticola]